MMWRSEQGAGHRSGDQAYGSARGRGCVRGVPLVGVLLLGVLGVLGAWRAAWAQPPVQIVPTEAGVAVAVPAGLYPVAGLAPWPDMPVQVEGLATYTDGSDRPLNIQIRRGPPHDWEGLPAAGSTLAAEWTQRFAAELDLPEAYDFTPDRYDPERGALSLQYKVAGPSAARLMERLPDTHPLWAPTLQAGEEPKIAKCVLGALLDGRPSATAAELDARASGAAVGCGLPDALIGKYLERLGPNEFEPSVTTVTYVAFFTRFGTLGTLVLAPLDRQSAVDEAAETLWRETEVAADARLPIAPRFDVYRCVQLAAIALGSCLAVFSFGGGLAWLLVRLGMRAKLAVEGSLVLLCALALTSLLRGAFGAEGGVLLGSYVLGSGLAFAPLVRWLSPQRGSPASRGRLARGQRGLSTVEYVVVLVLLVTISIGTWSLFGASVKRALSHGTDSIGALGELTFDELPSGVEGPSAVSSGAPANPPAAGQAATAHAQSGHGTSALGSDHAGSTAASRAAAPTRAAARASSAGGRESSTQNRSEPRGNAALDAAASALQALQPGRVLSAPKPPALPPAAGKVVAAAAKEPSLLLRGADIATDFVPYLSNVKDATIAITGVNPVTKEQVGTFGRVAAGVFAIPAAGNLAKYLSKGAKYVLEGGKVAYEAGKAAKMGTRIAGILGREAEKEIAKEGAERVAKEAAKATEVAAAGVVAKKEAEEGAREAANRALHEKYLDELRRDMGRPHVEDPELDKIMSRLYRTDAKIGSGSTAAAVRHEAATGERVGGRVHLQKAEEAVGTLEKWLKNNPTARPGDRAAAENVLRDTQNALGGK